MAVWLSIKKLNSFLWKYKWWFVFMVIFMLISSLAVNFIPIVLRDITNDVIEDRYDRVFDFLVMLVFLKAGELIFRGLSYQFSDRVLFPMSADIRVAVFNHLHKLGFAYHTEKSSGSLISLFKRGDNGVYGFFIEMYIFNLQIFIEFGIMLFVFASLYPKLIWVTLIVFILNSLFAIFSIKKNVKARSDLNEIEDNSTALVVDNMIAFDTVKYFANERYENERFRRISDKVVRYAYSYGASFRYIELGNGGIINFGMIAVIGVALVDLLNQSISVGEFVMASTFATVFFGRLMHMVFNFREIAKNFVDLQRYLAILDEPITVLEKPKKVAIKKWAELEKSGKYEIKLEGVDFGYGDSIKVLENIDLTIKPGESVALIGKSGAGKTTITKLLMRFYDPTKGKITIGGVNIKDLPKEAFRKKIGFVPQEAVLFNETIGYNIAYGREEFGMAELESATKVAHLYDFIQTLPENLRTMVGERGIKLSGGQKQRLSIARAIMENAPIIVFDEATSNLDSESEKYIQEAFWDVAKDKTTIIIAHRLSTVRKADRIIVFDNGSIVEQGTHRQLTNKESGIYKYLWELQTSGEIEND